MSAPPTSVNAGSSSPGLPTPTARDWKGQGHEGQLPNAVSLPPTPTTSEGTGIGHATQGGMNLRHAVSLLPTPRASDTGTPGRRASEGFRPPLSQVLLPTPKASDGTKGGPNQRGSSGDLTLPSATHRIGDSTAPPSPDGRRSPAAPHPGQLTIDDALPPPSPNG